MMIKLAVVSALLLAMPFEAVAAKVKAKFIDQEKKAILKPESKLVEKNSAKEYFGKVNKKGEAEFDKLEPGDYQLYGQSPGYMPNKSDWLSVGREGGLIHSDVGVGRLLPEEGAGRKHCSHTRKVR